MRAEEVHVLKTKKRVNKRDRKDWVRALVWDKNGGRCWYCGIRLNPFRNFTIDHMIPKSRAEVNNNLHNMVPCCRPCNLAKADLDIEEYRWKLGDPLQQFAFERKQWRARVSFKNVIQLTQCDIDALIEMESG